MTGLCYIGDIKSQKVTTVKKIRILVLLLAVAALLAACGTHAEEPVEETTLPVETTLPPETSEPTEPPTEPPVEEVAREMISRGEYQEAFDLLETAERNPETEHLRMRAMMGDVQVGQEIRLGHYEQDNIEANGAEEIAWVVLTVEDDKALLVSLACLDTQPYYEEIDIRTTWAECTVRTWLNEEFLSKAFDETELEFLLETELVNADNPVYGTPGGENTLDRVFLLSLDEAYTYLTDELRCAPVTAYAIAQGCYISYHGTGWWWLRSPGVYTRDAAYIDALGEISEYGYIIYRKSWAIRPAIWIDLSI